MPLKGCKSKEELQPFIRAKVLFKNNMSGIEDLAEKFLLYVLQNYGQSSDERIAAIKKAVNFMNLRCEISYEKGEGFFVSGKDRDIFLKFFKEVESKFPLGNFEREAIMVKHAMIKYKKSRSFWQLFRHSATAAF
jgi:hypothetical protein